MVFFLILIIICILYILLLPHDHYVSEINVSRIAHQIELIAVFSTLKQQVSQ